MANNQVEIDVVLNAKDATEGFETLGETSSLIADQFSKDNSLLGEGLGELTGNVTAVVGSVKGLSSAMTAAGTAGKTAWASILGPIGIALVAIVDLMQAFKEYSSEVSGASLKTEAYRASASELTSFIEELSDAQVKLNKADIEAFRIQSQRAQALTEEGQLLNEKGAEIRAEIALQKEAIVQIEKKTKSEKVNYVQRLFFETTIATKRREIAKLEARLSPITQKSDTLSIKGAKERAKLTEMRENKLKESPEFLKKIRELEAKISSEADRNLLQATKDTVNSQRKIAEIASKQKIKDLEGIEDISEDVRSKAILAERKRLEAEIATIEKNASNKRQARAQQRRAKREAEERKLQSELARIRELGYEQLRLEGAEVSEILEMRYDDELKQAGKNKNLQLIAEMKYQNAQSRIQNEADQKAEISRKTKEKAVEDSLNLRFERAKSFALETAEFDAKQIEDQTRRELALLNLRSIKEIQLNEHTEGEITELKRRESIERQKILDSSFVESMDTLKSMSKDLLKESTGAIYQSLVDAGQFDLTFEELKHDFDEKVGQAREEMLKAQASSDLDLFRQKEEEITNLTSQYESERQHIRAQQAQAIPLLFGNILKGLGQQASVEAVMELAKGFSKLGSPLTAAFAPAHFKASAIFAGVAATAGVGGAMLTNNANTSISRAGRGGGSGGTTSPTGTPQTTSIPNREEAESTSMVFNINFGGAVIYDTKQSAEQALADRITNIQNRQRRGAPRRGAM